MVLVCRFILHRRPWTTTLNRTFTSRKRAGYLPSSSAAFLGNYDSSAADQLNEKSRRRSGSDIHENQPRDLTKSRVTFDEFIADQIQRARRSVLIRFASKSTNAYEEIYHEICKQLRLADISVIPPTNSDGHVHSPDGLKTFILLETSSREPLDRFIIHNTKSLGTDQRIQPCRTRILHFTADLNGDSDGGSVWATRKRTKTVAGTDTFELNKALKDCLWLDEQMRVLVDETTLTEHGTRLRFFVASLIEDAFRGVLPLSVCTPFGSTTNGFGHANSDLDMDFMLEESSATNSRRSTWLCAFRIKLDDARKQTQRMIELMGRMIRTCMPYCSDVAQIVNARVPIVKFVHDAGGFGCDLTVDNSTGIASSKILWIYTRLDNRVRPLMFTIRRWAALMNITRESPGDWLTNFQLLCLVVYFLQTRSSGPILPSIRTLRRLASSNESFGIIGDPDRLASLLRTENFKRSTTRESLGDLLRGFFKFYGHEFQFDHDAISLEKGNAVERLDISYPLIMENPLESGHNIAKNVSLKELYHFRSCARRALAILETKELVERDSASNQDDWGLLALFNPSMYQKKELVQTTAMSPSTESESSGVLLVDDLEIEIKEKQHLGDQDDSKIDEKDTELRPVENV